MILVMLNVGETSVIEMTLYNPSTVDSGLYDFYKNAEFTASDISGIGAGETKKSIVLTIFMMVFNISTMTIYSAMNMILLLYFKCQVLVSFTITLIIADAPSNILILLH